MACREKFVRRMPGRIAGQRSIAAASAAGCSRCKPASSTSAAKKPPATSARTKACSRCGPRSIWRRWGRKDCAKSAELACRRRITRPSSLTAASGLDAAFDRPTFKEFVVRDRDGRVDELLARGARAPAFFAGVPLGRWYPELADCLLVAVTEKRTRARDRRAWPRWQLRKLEHACQCVTPEPRNCCSNCPSRAAARRGCRRATCPTCRSTSCCRPRRWPPCRRRCPNWPSPTSCGTSRICRR